MQLRSHHDKLVAGDLFAPELARDAFLLSAARRIDFGLRLRVRGARRRQLRVEGIGKIKSLRLVVARRERRDDRMHRFTGSPFPQRARRQQRVDALDCLAKSTHF